MNPHDGAVAHRLRCRFDRALAPLLLALGLALPLGPAPEAGLADGVWSVIAPSIPSARKWAAVVFDPLRQRLIVIDGYPGPMSDVWMQPVTGAPAWSRVVPAGTGPSARFAHSAIYQPAQDRVILFGGYDTALRNDVWALSLSGAPTWTRLTPAGAPPAPRWANVAVYDAARERMVIFGGFNGSASLNDAWALTLGPAPAWSQIPAGGAPPQPRTNVTGVYDIARDQVVVFGGFNTGTQQFLNDTWALSLAGSPAWTRLLPAGVAPAPRRDHSMIYDAARGQVVLFGGDNGFPLGDVFTLSLGPSPAWSQTAPAGPAPAARSAHRAVYDGAQGRMWIFGGDAGQFTQSPFLDDTWGLSLGAPYAWERLEDTPGFPTSPRRNYGMACAAGSVVVFGGDDAAPRDDTGLLRLTPVPAWEPALPAAKPTARFGHHMMFDAPRNRVLLLGGYDGSYLNDVQAWSMATGEWQAIATSGAPPSPRMYYGLVCDPVRERMLVIGGHPEFLNDVWALPLSGPPEWAELAPSGFRPSPRYAHSVVYHPGRDRVILFGGYDGAYRNDVWELSLSGTPAWTEIAAAGVKPAGRWASGVAYDGVRERLIVFGGWDGGQARNDVWALSLGATPEWTQLSPGGPQPEPRANLEAVYDPAGDRLITMAGYDPISKRFFKDTWALTWGTLPTPALVSLVSARGEPGRASIRWQVEDRGGASLVIQRRGQATAWTAVGEGLPDGEQRVTFDDRGVEEGARYGYRLAIREGAAEWYAGEVWLDIPRAARLVLAGARPNPAGRGLTIHYSLADASPATLELFDTSGRRMFVRDVGNEGAGEHELRVVEADAWPSGVYHARLRQHGHALTSRVIVIR